MKNIVIDSFNSSSKNDTWPDAGLSLPIAPLPLLMDEPLDEAGLSEIRTELGYVISMAEEEFMEPQLEAAKILSDLSQQEHMQQPLRDTGCIQTLAKLLEHGEEWTQQYAVFALANLSTSHCCQV